MTFLETIKASGVVGAGGAGFPTHVKLNAKADILIINAIECEPLLETDKYLMRNFPEDLVKGTEKIGSEISAKRKVIALKSKNKKEIARVREAIQNLKLDIEVKEVGNFYPAGDEQMLVREVAGVTILPTQIPLSKGIVVTNVATVLDVMSEKPVTHRVITVTGEVNSPTLIKVPVGTSIKECLELAGGPKIEGFKVILGGPMMGKPCNEEEISTTYVTKTLGGLIVLPENHAIINRHNLSIKHILSRAASACIQCRMCTDLCPRYLNGHPLYPHLVMRAAAFSDTKAESCKSAMLCCECGVCEMYACPMGLSPKTINQYVKTEFLKANVRWENKEGLEYEVSDMREYRKVPTERLIRRLDLSKYVKYSFDDVIEYEPSRAIISLKQHIGAPATPIVDEGEYVVKGQLIASIGESLGANVHSSIDGLVSVKEGYIIVEKR